MGAPVALGSAAASYILGKGTSSDFKENELQGLESSHNYGDTLRQMGTPNVVAAPLGFALDVGLDPLNWLAAGDSALIPRAATGAVKGGTEGLGAAVKSWFLENSPVAFARDAEGTLRVGAGAKWIRGGEMVGGGPSGRVFTNYTANPTLYANLMGQHPYYQALATDLTNANERYDALAHGGLDFMSRYADAREDATTKLISRAVGVAGEKFDAAAERTPWIKNAADFAAYRAPALGEKMFADADAARAAEDVGLTSASEVGGAYGRRFRTDDSLVAKALRDGTISDNAPDALANLLKNTRNGMEDSQRVKFDQQFAELKDKYLAGDPAVVNRINAWVGYDKGNWTKVMTPEQFNSIFNTFYSGVDWYDKSILKLMSTNPMVARTLQAYGIAGQLMRTASIGLSVPARVNALMSNLAFASMGGIDIGSGGYLRALRLSWKHIMSSEGNIGALSELLGGEKWYTMANDYPQVFRSITGINPRLITEGKVYVDSVFDQVARQLRAEGRPASELEVLNQIKSAYGAEVERAYAAEMRASQIRASAPSATKKLLHGADISTVPENSPEFGEDVKTVFHTQEMNTGVARKLIRDLKRAEDNGVPGAKYLRWYFQEPLADYGKYDQVAKLAGLGYLTNYGFTEGELRLLKNWYKFDSSDVIKAGTGNMYKLTPKAALKVVEEMHLNYGAMPSFVKIMKNLPFIGSNYLSFVYGAGTVTAKTALYNPGFFNKVNFLLNEVGGSQNPLEKQALDTQYYSRLKAPEYVKWPFVQKNPIYINMAQAFPHFGMYFLQDSNRSFGDTYGDKLAALIDKTPFFKTPAGQVLLNYVIMPYLVGQANATNQFGQPLYAPGSSGAEVAGHMASDFITPFIPRTPAGVAGLLPNLVTDPNALSYMPATFRGPQQAVNWGMNAQGIQPQSAEAQTFNKWKALLNQAAVNATRVSESAGDNSGSN